MATVLSLPPQTSHATQHFAVPSSKAKGRFVAPLSLGELSDNDKKALMRHFQSCALRMQEKQASTKHRSADPSTLQDETREDRPASMHQAHQGSTQRSSAGPSSFRDLSRKDRARVNRSLSAWLHLVQQASAKLRSANPASFEDLSAEEQRALIDYVTLCTSKQKSTMGAPQPSGIWTADQAAQRKATGVTLTHQDLVRPIKEHFDSYLDRLYGTDRTKGSGNCEAELRLRRHDQSLTNVGIRTTKDAPLTDLGIERAERFGKWSYDMYEADEMQVADITLCSPLKRNQMTAKDAITVKNHFASKATSGEHHAAFFSTLREQGGCVGSNMLNLPSDCDDTLMGLGTGEQDTLWDQARGRPHGYETDEELYARAGDVLAGVAYLASGFHQRTGRAPVIDLETHANIGGKLGMHLCPPGDKNPLATSLVNGQLNQYQMAVSADGDNVSWKPTGMTKCPYRDLDLTRHEGEPSFHTFFEGKIAAAKSGEGSNRDVSSGLYEGPVRPEDVSSTIFEA